MKYALICIWLYSVNIMFMKFVTLFAVIFFSWLYQHSIVGIHHNLFVQSADGHMGNF